MRLRNFVKSGHRIFDYRAEDRFFSEPITTVQKYPWMLDDLRLWVPDPEGNFEGKDVLEIGASEGALASTVVEHFEPRKYIALDIVQRRLIGVAKLAEKSQCLRPLAGSAFALPLEDSVVDVILNNATLAHLPRMEVAISEFARVLRPGGKYFGREPNGYNLAVRWHTVSSRAASPNAIPVLEPRVKRAFESAGFDVTTEYFWRRFPALKNRFLAVSFRIHAEKVDK